MANDRACDGFLKLRDCLVHLQEGKINERKDQIEKLKRLLTQSDVLQLLDKNSSTKRRSDIDWRYSITWSKVFTKVTDYIQTEAERIVERESGTSNPTPTVIANRSKEKKCCSDFFKYIVKVISSRRQHTVCFKIWNHMQGVLSNSFTVTAFGLDYTNVLLKDILSEPQMCISLTLENYQSMIKLYIKFIKTPPQGWDRTILTQVLYNLLLAAHNLGDLKPQRLFEFFSSMFNSVKSEKVSRYHEYLLKALLLLCQNTAVHCRMQMCKFGEVTLSRLMQLWKTKPTDAIKELMLEFFLLQLTLHHPSGVVDEESGAFADNWPLWKQLRTEMYLLVIRELRDMCERNKYSTNKGSTLHPYFIAVSVEICALVFQDTYQSIEVTQVPETFEVSQVKKKRRIETEFKSFIEELTSSNDLIPWLQLLSAFLQKYPKVVSLREIATVINLLMNLHLSCKQIEVKVWLLTSCQAAVEAFCVVQKSTAADEAVGIVCDWWRLWELGIKCVALMYQCHETGHKLLSTLLLNKLVGPKAEFLNLYRAGSNNKPSCASLVTLAVYMDNFALPSMLSMKQTIACSNQSRKDWFRYQVFNWISMSEDVSDLENILSYLSSPDVHVSNVQYIATLLSCICMQDYKAVVAAFVAGFTCSNNGPIKWINKLEEDLLQCTFDLPSKKLQKSVPTNETVLTPLPSCSLLIPVGQKTMELLLQISKKLLDNSDSSQSFHNDVHMKVGCMIFLFMKTLFLNGVWSKAELISLHLTSQIQESIGVSIKTIWDEINSQQSDAAKTNALREFFLLLDVIIGTDENCMNINPQQAAILADWSISVLPHDLPNILFTMIDSSHHKSQQNHSPANLPLAVQQDIDLNKTEMDIDEFMDAGPSVKRKRNRYADISVDEDVDPFEESVQLNSSTNNVAFFQGDEQCFSEGLKMQLLCINCMNSFIKLTYVKMQSEFDSSLYIKLFLSIIDRKSSQEDQNLEDILLVLKVMESLVNVPNLNIEAIQTLVNTIKSLLNKYSKYREICFRIIDITADVFSSVSSLTCSGDSVELAKKHLLHLFHILWQKEKEYKHGHDVSLALARALCKLIKIDSSLEWANTSRTSDSFQKSAVKDDIQELFQSHHLKVRLFMANQVELFVQNSNNVPLNVDVQQKNFEVIYGKSILQINQLKNEEQQSEVLQDQKQNYSSTFLHFLCNSYMKCTPCRKHILFIVFELIKNQNAFESMVIKALLHIAQVFKYKTVREFLQPDLVYLYHRWIKMNYAFEAFPVRVLKFDDCQTFFTKYYQKLVPLYFYHSDFKTIESIANFLNLSVKDVLIKCLPQILARIYSWQASIPNNDGLPLYMPLLEEKVSKENVTSCLAKCTGDVFTFLLHLLDEPIGTSTIEESQINCHCLSHVTPQQFCTAINIIKSSIGLKGSFISYLCSKQNNLQNILLSIHTQLSESLVKEEQSRAVLMYSVLVELFEPEFETKLKKFKTFLLTEIIHSIINFVVKRDVEEENDAFVHLKCIKLIRKMCEKTMNICTQDIGNLLPFIVSRLIPFVSSSSFGQEVFNLLSYLVVDCASILENNIVLLDPFPDSELFRKIQQTHKEFMYKSGPYTLKEELDHFNRSYQITGRSTFEGIKHLYAQLRSNKKELLQIVNELQEKKLFSEDTKGSELHQLICILVHLCTLGNADENVQSEAGRCLGEIGPIDLSTVVLQAAALKTESNNKRKIGDSIYYDAYSHILELLCGYLKDSRIVIKSLSTDVLKDVFKTKAALQFLVTCERGNWFDYLYPFFSSREENASASEVTVEKLEKIDRPLVWAPDEGEYSDWICNLVSSILRSGITGNVFFQQLVPICEKEAVFSSQILPYLIHAIVLRNEHTHQLILSEYISLFFTKLSHQLTKKSNSSFSTPVSSASYPCSLYTCKASVQTMLSVVHYLRLQEYPWADGNICSNSWTGLDLDYLLIAQAAMYCSAYFSAIMYVELWWNNKREKTLLFSENEDLGIESSQGMSQSSSPMALLNSEDQERVALVHQILLEAYTSIGDSDSIHGCIEILNDTQAVIRNHYIVEKKWDSLLNLYDKDDDNEGLLKALKNCGLDNTLRKYIESQTLCAEDSSSEIMECQYECAWRMNRWDDAIPESEKPGFQECFFKCLQFLKSQNENGFMQQLKTSRFLEFENLSHTSLESVRCILPVLSHLQMLVLVEDYANVNFKSLDISEINEKWSDHLKIPCVDFEFQEPVSWLQCSLLRQKSSYTPCSPSILEEYAKCLEVYAVQTRKENCLKAASKAISLLESSSFGSKYESLRWKVEEAKILWMKKEHRIANQILKSVLYDMEKDNSEDAEFLVTYAKTLTLKGKWLGETRSENATTIMEDYLEKAIKILEDNIDYSKRKELKVWDSYLAIARYADSQYQSIVNYKKSTEYQSKLELMANSNATLESMNKNRSDVNRTTQITLKRQYNIDQEELNNLDIEQERFLMKAISNYLICLSGTAAYDVWIFRLTALWFHNFDNLNVNLIMQQKLSGIEKYKFLPLMYQLAARMGSQGNRLFCTVLGQLIKDIALDHPHHALPVIFSMSNAAKDLVESPSVNKKNSASSSNSAGKERTLAAKKLITEVQKVKHKELVKDLSVLCDAYIALAYMTVDAKQKTGKIPVDQKIMKMKNLSTIPVITEVLKVDRSCQYNNIVGIHSFHPEYRLCGGINVPKVIKCIGLDGVPREQLVKGKDDLRQDAVMQQVFSLVNCLLEENNETKRRKLSIRTYKIVPMSRRSGVLQWCAGTQVLSQYLIGPNPPGGAHKKYYPNFWTHSKCQEEMVSIAAQTTLSEKRKIFDNICKNCPPVFRYFFLENFSDSASWFERRQLYTKSVATSSIGHIHSLSPTLTIPWLEFLPVGYILGLGDRHVNNILIDKRTAEVVHIDFGIAFEKGKILATPETVPFRLTRDIIDGMGFIGLEGVFKRCSEKTMEVMRNSQDVLLTILEVLLYDPLYDWSVPAANSSSSSLKGERNSSSPAAVSGQDTNKLAERALMRLQKKLQGLEEGMTLSVSGQVNMLIQQARDPKNLCRIYAGWKPFL